MMFGLDVVGSVVDKLLGIVTKFVPDKEKQAEMAHEIMMSKINGDLKAADDEVKLMLAQIETNKAEAASPNMFVAGWRPGVGWVCVAAFGYVSVIRPVSEFLAVVAFGYTGPFPAVETDITMQVLMGMLGFGALRMVEKIKGVAR